MTLKRIAPLVVFVPLTALAVTACLPSDIQKRTIQDGYSKYLSRQFVESESIADDYIKKNPTVDNVDEAYYLRGVARYSRNNKAEAAEDLQTAIAKTKRPDMKQKAFRTLGDIAYDSGDWQLALADYQKSMEIGKAPVEWGQEKNAASAKPDTYVNYRVGACLQNLGQWDKARGYFDTVVSVGGDPQLTGWAVARLNAHHFSLQFGAFADGPKAAELIKQLKAAGITATAATELRDGKVLYMVRSGSYNTNTEAEAARSKLVAKFPVVAIVP
jgi:tetratricopeptide (TPR) repeat protein